MLSGTLPQGGREAQRASACAGACHSRRMGECGPAGELSEDSGYLPQLQYRAEHHRAEHSADQGTLYEKEWESIIGNCDTLLFLGGGNEPTSLEFIVKLLGKETIATRTRGQTKGRSGSSSTNFQQTGRDLMTIHEVRKLDTHKAILFIRGEDPVLDKKYNIKRHPNIKLTTDGKATPYIHKPQGVPDYALPDLPYAFKSLDDYDFIDVEEPEHELSEKEKDFKPDKTE